VSEARMTEPQYSVVRPVGRWAATPVPITVRVPRRVGFVWDHVFRGDEMFAIAEEELRAHDPRLTFVPYQAFGDIHGRDAASVVASLPALLRAEEVDAVIVGVGA
jgi:hypothetical protein